jgi:hypothetical protein
VIALVPNGVPGEFKATVGPPSIAATPLTSQPLGPMRLITNTFPVLAAAAGSVIVFEIPPGLLQRIV